MTITRISFRLRALLALAILALGASGAASAQPPPPPGMHDGPMGQGGMHGPLVISHAAELGLGPEQVDAIQALYKSAHPSMEQMHSQMRTQMQTLMQTKPSDPNYSTVVAKTAQALGELTSQSIVQESQLRSQVWAALTASQRDKLMALESKMHEPAERHGPLPPPSN